MQSKYPIVKLTIIMKFMIFHIEKVWCVIHSFVYVKYLDLPY